MSELLQAVEGAAGAVFTRVSQREMPAHFGPVRAEWDAVRHRCGLLDAGFRRLLRLTGTDRATFLQGMLSNDVASLRDGQGVYAAFLTQQGRVVADVRVYVVPDEMWLDTPTQCVASLRMGLERYLIADDVEFVDDERWAPLISLEGPGAAETVDSVLGDTAGQLEPFTHRAVPVDGGTVRVVAVNHTGESGFLLFGSPDLAGRLWERCHGAGAVPVGLDALEILRVEAGMPWYGRDMDESMLVSEVGIEAAISSRKGCYLGQEVVERVAARGQVQRRLVGMLCEGRVVPAPQAKLTDNGKEIGWVTSAVWSPACEAVVALGYTRRTHWQVGSTGRVTVPGGTSAVRLVSLPFYHAGQVTTGMNAE